MNTTYENVRDHGAKANGHDDDSEAFQSAVNKAIQGRCAVYIPAGEYLIQNVTVSLGLDVFGDGMRATMLRPAAGKFCFTVDARNNDVYYTSFRCLSFRGNKVGGDYGGGINILADKLVKFLSISDVSFYGLSTAILATGGGSISWSKFTQLTLGANENGPMTHGLLIGVEFGQNIISNCLFGGVSRPMTIGTKNVPIGDTIIAQCFIDGGPVSLLGSPAHYRTNFSISGCQFDGGSGVSQAEWALKCHRLDNIILTACNFGGGKQVLFYNCSHAKVDKYIDTDPPVPPIKTEPWFD